ncbi:MAG: T9SS type A sorting domain-containing protein [Dysgonamonadaceae bacterium]|nr:T9SS type A sorting domain-containing protein [Dysgonamonadaceae bacterium]
MKKIIAILAVFIFSGSNSFAYYPDFSQKITLITENIMYGVATSNCDLELYIFVPGRENDKVPMDTGPGIASYVKFYTRSDASGKWSLDFKIQNETSPNWNIENYLGNITALNIYDKTNVSNKVQMYTSSEWLYYSATNDVEIPETNIRDVSITCLNEYTISGTGTPNVLLVLGISQTEGRIARKWITTRVNSDGTWNLNYRSLPAGTDYFLPYFDYYSTIDGSRQKSNTVSFFCYGKQYDLTQNELNASYKYCDPKDNPAYIPEINADNLNISEQVVAGQGSDLYNVEISGKIYADDVVMTFQKSVPVKNGKWNWNYRALGINPYLTNVENLIIKSGFYEVKNFELQNNLVKNITGENVENTFFIKTIDDDEVVGKATPGATVVLNAIASNRLVTVETTASAGGTWVFNYKSLGLGDYLRNATGIVISHKWQHIELNPEAIEAVKNGTYTATQHLAAGSSNFYVYPSVTTNNISIGGTAGKNVQRIEIYSNTGQRVTQNYDTNQVNVAGLAPGTYIAKIQDGDIVQSCKFVKR